MNPFPFFKKKRRAKAVSAESAPSAPSTPSPDEAETSAPPAGGAEEPDQPPHQVTAAETSERDRSKDSAALTAAFAQWRTKLATHDDVDVDPSATDVLDVSNIHPSGAAQFYSGSPTSLKALFWEQGSLAAARTAVAALLERRADLEEIYGSAPVSYVSGILTWAELKPGQGTASADPLADETLDIDGDGGERDGVKDAAEGNGDAAGADTGGKPSADGDVHDGNVSDTPDGADQPDKASDIDEGVTTPASGGGEAVEDDGGDETEDAAGPNGEVREGTANEAEAAGTDRDAADTERDENQPYTGATIVTLREPALRRDVYISATSASDPVFTLADNADVSSAVLDALRRHGAPVEAVHEVRELARNPQTQGDALAKLRELGRAYLPGCDFTPTSIIGLVSSPSEALLDDLVAVEPLVRGSLLVSDLVTGTSVPAEVDRNPRDRAPALERGAGRLDVAELDAVEAVAEGTSVFLNVPPGADARPALASIAADAAASGKVVLYVSGKATSARAFVGQMEGIGLGEAIADFSNLEEIPLRLRQGIRLKSDPIDTEATAEDNARLEENRERVEEFMRVLHEKNPTWGISPFDLLGDIVRLSLDEDGPRPRVRLSEETVANIADDDQLTHYAGLVDEAIRLDRSASKDNPWADSAIFTRASAEQAVARATELIGLIDTMIADIESATEVTGLRSANTLEEWATQLHLFSDVGESLDTFRPRVFERSVSSLVIATGSKEWRADNNHHLSGSERRRLRKEAVDMVRPGRSAADLHAALTKVSKQRDQWKELSETGTWPELPTDLDSMYSTYEQAAGCVEGLAPVLPEGTMLTSMPLPDLKTRMVSLVEATDDLTRIPRRNEIGQEIEKAGLTELLADLNDRSVPGSRARDELHAARLASMFEHVFSTEEALGLSRTIGDLVDEVLEGDRRHVESMPLYVSRAIVSRMRALITKKKDETLEVDAKLADYGVSGLRESVASSGYLLASGRPVWVMSAVSVATYIPPMEWADVVILDGIDSSELAPLIPTIVRGATLVVAGNKNRGGEAIESLARALPVIDLPVISSRHDELTARFLASHGFSPDLDVYASAPSRPTPRVMIVDGTGVPGPKSGLVEAPEKEVRAVVDAVLDIVLTRPNDSLAVIAANAMHADKIRAAVRAMASTSLALASFVDPTRSEPFTVVDITNAASLQRDHVILTVGLGKTVHGRLLHSFGVLSTERGMTGLVDALQAPRASLTMISSFSVDDIDRSRLSADGTKLLVDLLEFYQGATPGTVTPTGDTPTNALLTDVAQRLTEKGYVAELGYSRVGSRPIPLVVGHPDIPGRWAVAVTIDDEAYVAEPSIRRRAWFWPESLRSRGWSVIPLYSTTAFFEPNRQVSRIIDAVDAVLAEHRRPEAPVSVTPEREDRVLRPVRGPRPSITPGLPLAAYSDEQLDRLAAWIVSDGEQRTEAELVDELRGELDLGRKGPQVDAVLRNVARRNARQE